jgi:general secretion pathway protein D
MKLLLRIATITLVSALVILQSGTVHCANQNPRKPFSWNFSDVDLSKVIQAVSEYTGQNFEYDPALLKGKVTMIINTEIPPDLAYPVLEAILAGRGFALVPVIEDNLIKIVPAPDAMASPLPTDVGKDVGEMTPYENLVTQILPVEYAQASDLVAVLDSFSSAVGRVDAYAPANLLIITERASQVRRLVDLVQRIDVAGFEQRWEVIPLKYHNADALAQKIADVLSEEVSAIAAGQRTPATPRPGRPTERIAGRAAASRGPTIVGAVQTPLRIIPDEWSNSLIVVGVDAMRLKVRQLVQQLDVDRPFDEGNFHVYVVQNADVLEVAEALQSLISGTPDGSRAGGRPQQQGGQPGGSAPSAQAFAGEVGISPYEPTNALLITASPQDWRILESVLEAIDVPERQVYVEAVIMEVTVNEGVTVGVDAAALDEEDWVAATMFGDIASYLVQGPLGLTGPFVGVIDGTIANPLNPDQKMPMVPVILTAIQTVTDLDVLSAPAILTTKISSGSRQRGRQGGTEAGPMGFGDGGTGTRGQTRMSGSGITVGKNVPVIRGTARPLAQTATTPTLFNSVGREQVGVILDVSPQIIADEYVKLQIRVEVSDIIPSEVGMDVNVSGPTFSVSEITDTVVIRDGYMGILGGLMSQGEGRSRTQIPILGDIPLLGFFFRKTTRTQEKHNLVVIITPHIIKTDEDLDKLTTRYRENYDLQRLEMHEDLNVWRKVFKKVKVKKDTERSERASRVQEVHADRVMGRNFNR